MSYILDALKKSESEENRGEIPDISSEHNYGQNNGHNQTPLDDMELESDASRRWLVPALVVALLLFMMISVVMWLTRFEAPNVMATATDNSQQTVAQEFQAASADKVATEPSAESTEHQIPWQVTVQEVEVGQPILSKVKSSRGMNAGADASSAPRNEANEAVTSADLERTKSLSSSKLMDSDSLLSQLPPLRYTTHIYATETKDRFVLLNGKVYEVGSRISADLRVADILENDLVLEFKGQKITVPSLEDINL